MLAGLGILFIFLAGDRKIDRVGRRGQILNMSILLAAGRFCVQSKEVYFWYCGDDYLRRGSFDACMDWTARGSVDRWTRDDGEWNHDHVNEHDNTKMNMRDTVQSNLRQKGKGKNMQRLAGSHWECCVERLRERPDPM